MLFRTPRELVEGLRQNRKGALRQLELLCRPGVVGLLRRRFGTLEVEKERQRSERTIVFIRVFLVSRHPEEFDPFPGDKPGWRWFRIFCLLKAAKLLWAPGSPAGGGGLPARHWRSPPAFAPGEGPVLALGYQTRYHLRHFCRPLEEAPGDLVEFLWVNDESFWVLVADAIGHSWPAYLLVQGLSGYWKSLAALPDMTPGNLLSLLQEQLVKCLPDGTFVDAVVARFDPSGVTVAPAGPARVLIRRRNGTAVHLHELGGGFLGIEYPEPQVGHQETWPFEPGDELALATDGLYEYPFGGSLLLHVILSLLARVAQGDCLHTDILAMLNYALARCPPCDDIAVATVRRV